MDTISAALKGHDILAVERFQDNTQHMIEFIVLREESPVGAVGDHMRLFLTDAGYGRALDCQRRAELKIKRHAAIIEGHILYDRPKKSRGH